MPVSTEEREDQDRERHERAWRERERLLDTGQVQLGPGMPLLPPSYRGSGDFVGVTRSWIVRHGEELIAGFQKERDALHWIAWAAVERGYSVEEFSVVPVTLMSRRRSGPLFDGLPAAPSQDGWKS